MSTHSKGLFLSLPRWLVCFGLLGCFVCSLRAEVRYRAILPGQTYDGIDFDSDGASELTFTSYALTTHSLEPSGTLFMRVVCSQDTEVLLNSGHVSPLGRAERLSPTPSHGTWGRALSGSTVWTFPFTSPPPSGTNIIVVGDDPLGEDPQQPIPEGVGMRGYGSFMGVRFQRSGAWHYAWVHFGVRDAAPTALPSLDLPTVLGFAYESSADVAVEVGSKPMAAPITGLEFAGPAYLRIRWSARIGQNYHIETKALLDWHAWSPMGLRIAGVADTMMIDLPITEDTQFFRVIEAD
jgi:hypothetical protein